MQIVFFHLAYTNVFRDGMKQKRYIHIFIAIFLSILFFMSNFGWWDGVVNGNGSETADRIEAIRKEMKLYWTLRNKI